MNRPARWALGFGFVVVLLVAVSDFTQKASSSNRKGGPDAPAVMASVAYRSPGDRHKVRVSDPKLAHTLQSQGGRFISDYGSYALLEVSTNAMNQLAAGDTAESADENNLILLNSGTIDTTSRKAQTRRVRANGFSGKQMSLIQFAGPIQPEWYQSLVATGVRVVTYIPNNAYLVYGTAENLQAVQQLANNKSVAQWSGDYTAQFRVDPAVSAANGKSPRRNLSARGNEQFTIQLVEDAPENAVTLSLIEQFKLEPLISQERMLGYVNVKVALPRDVVTTLIAARGDVVSIQQWITPVKLDERQDIIVSGNLSGNVPVVMNYLTYLAGKGFAFGTPSSFAVNLSDSGIDNATTTPNHFALYTLGNSSVPANSRIIYNRLQGTPNPGSTLQGCDGHGNINSHIIGGYVPDSLIGVTPHSDASGFRWGLGIAPFVKIGSSVIFDPNTFTSPTYQNLESQAYRDGSRISSNSWGSAANTYTTDAQQYD